MNKAKDNTLYGRNRRNKVALCESCVYDGFCRARIKYYKCQNYIKKNDYAVIYKQPEKDT